jgi:F-type H+-transporting ATPase subunit epsilon
MADALTLRVITPDAIALDTTAASVQLPAMDGGMGVLPRHAAMVTALGTGLVSYAGEGQAHESDLFVSGGFAEVRDNTVRIVTETSERVADIDLERAKTSEQRARQRMTERHPDLDLRRAEAALGRALLRLRFGDLARRR